MVEDINLKDILTRISITMIISIIYLLIKNKSFTMIKVANLFFVMGLVQFIIGLFRITNVLGFYDFAQYSWKQFKLLFKDDRLYANKNQSYHEYLNNNKYDKPYINILIVGIIFILLSIIINTK